MSDAADAAPAGSGWRFRLFGFAVVVPLNALIGVLVIALLWYPQFIGTGSRVAQWLLAAVFAVLLTLSILVHELAHGFAARAFGYRVTGITLWAMGGFTSYRTGARHGPGREIVIAGAGPAATLAVAAVAAFAERVVPWPTAQVLLSAVAGANVLVGVFNLLPGSPLDGGSVVKAVVWAISGSQATGQVAAGWIGRGLAVLMVATPFLLAWAYGVPPSLTTLLVGLVLGALLWFGATASLQAAAASRQLQEVPALRLGQPVVPVSEQASVAEALARLGPDGTAQVVAVDPSGRPTGVLIQAAAEAVPPEQRDRMPLRAVCAGVSQAVALGADATAQDVLQARQHSGSRYVFVVAADGSLRVVDTDVVFVAEGP